MSLVVSALSNNNNDSCPSSNNKKFTAIVIGGGPAGLAVSLGLGNLESCEKVYIIEKQPKFDSRGANFLLAYNGVKALEELSQGIQQDFEHVGVVSYMVPDYPAILLPWWEMRNVILNRVRTMGNDKIKIYTNKRFTRIIENDDDAGVTVHFDNDNDELKVLKGDILIGADGVHSNVRKHLQLKPGTEIGLRTIIRGHVNNAHEIPQLQPLLSRGLVPIGGNFGGIDGLVTSVFNYDEKLKGKLAWVVGSIKEFSKGEEGEDDDDDDEDKLDGVATALSILDPTKASKDQVDDLNLFRALVLHTEKSNVHVFPQGKVMDFSPEVLNQYNGRWGGRGRITLLGDAAHAFPSSEGQGGSQAFEDAVVLTRLLKEKYYGGQEETTSFETILEEFEMSRLPRVKKLHQDQTERFAIKMNGGTNEMWSTEFMKWVFEGV